MAILGTALRRVRTAPLSAASGGVRVDVVKALFIGSLDALDVALDVALAELEGHASPRVCVVATAAAFRGPAAAIEEVEQPLARRRANVVTLTVLDRASANDPDVVAIVVASDLVILCDGAVLHARSVWRHSLLGEELGRSSLLCVGATGSVLGATMIDPRGGAPTTGLGLFDDVVLGVHASAEQSQRTRDLLVRETLVELGPRSMVAYDGAWRVLDGRDLEVTRAGVAVDLGLGDGQ